MTKQIEPVKRQALADAESEETDGAPMYLTPDLSAYTR